MVYKPGLFWQTCDICSRKGYNTEMVKTWNGLIVHRSTCFDGPRDPLDFPPPLRPERPSVPDPRPPAADRPTVLETTVVTSIASTTAASGGIISNNGGAVITEYGVCWATTPGPDTDDSETSDGAGPLSDLTVTQTDDAPGEDAFSYVFTSNLTGLSASTKYFVRAYAKNAIGTSYGNTEEFTTLAA